ncbi:hypothetical protein OEZ86_002783 [Tetradesmus obliquus]|nr:hypothetical protein OEZ86_002783 [Tetradesmus obliquus]
MAMGFAPTDTVADANLIWARWDPFEKNHESERMQKAHEQLKRLTNHQLVNQVPGLGFLVVKSELAKMSSSISAIPRTFQLPEEHAAWQQFISSEAGKEMEWVRKNAAHRGVQIIPDLTAPQLQELQGVLVQQLVRSHLIGGRSWDVGVYVAITQLEPLMAYVFTGSVLLRFCSKPYQRDITPDTDISTYVVTGLDDFTPGPQVDAMQPHYDDAYADTAMGSSMSLAALRGQLGSAGINTTKWWLDVQGTIVQVLQEAVPKMEAHRSYYYPAARANFFTMLRFDFLLGEQGNSYLLEVNHSPGLHRPDIDLSQQLLSRKLVHDLISLKGLGPEGRHNQFTNPTLTPLKYHMDSLCVGEPDCGSNCSEGKDCLKPQCKLCKKCKSLWQVVVLTNVQAEHQHAHAFMRVHPPHKALAQHLDDAGVDWQAYFDSEQRPDSALVKMWLDKKCEQDFCWC